VGSNGLQIILVPLVAAGLVQTDFIGRQNVMSLGARTILAGPRNQTIEVLNFLAQLGDVDDFLDSLLLIVR
jgi:hypothetical protein